jgi:Tol biopolymer transport system component/Flp pilus assembly protein TadD
MKHFFHFLLSIILLTLLVSACGGSPEAHVVPTSAPTQAAPTEEVAPTETPVPTAQDHIQQGNDYYDQGDWEKASAEYKAALALEPDNLEAITNLGMVSIELDQYEQAVSQFQTVLDAKPNDPKANGGMCIALAFTQPEIGEKQCLDAIVLSPNNADVQNGLGIAYAKQGKSEEALAAFQKAIDLDPQHNWAHNNLGRTYLDLGRYDEALVELNKAIEINPQNALAYYNLGLAYAKQGKYDEAIPQYEKALSIDPEMSGVYKDLGIIYQDLGEDQKAAESFQNYLDLSPDDPQSDQIKALIAKLSGTSEPAEVFVKAKVVFVSERDGNYEIYSMNTDGSDITRLTDNPAKESEPIFSPDGTRILFVSDRSGNADIFSMKSDGTDVVQLTNDPANDYSPAWSPNGAAIGFMSERNGNPDIFIMNPDGTKQSALIADKAVDLSPSFSNKEMAFVSNRDGEYNLYVVNGASGEVRRLTQGMGTVTSPDWSPNERYIIFAANPGNSFDIFIIKPDGSGLQQITSNDVNEYNPSWSPDSNYIMFSVGDKENSEIAIINESGKEMVLMENMVFDGMPAWGPME